MGITRGSARLLLEESKRRPFGGSVMQMGKMFIFLDEQELSTYARKHSVRLASGVDFQPSHDPILAAHGCMNDASFFRSLGFDEVRSLDAAAWEGADVVADFNLPMPAELHGRHDLVFEGGTLQSIFDLPQAMTNIFQLLKPGGRIIHAMTPSHNHVDLGFFMFSPTFFHDYYVGNGWQLDTLLLCEHFSYFVAGRLESSPWDVYEYEPGVLDHLSYGRYGDKQLTFFIVATKIDGSTSDRIPQQSYYQKLWAEDRETREAALAEQAAKIANRQWWYRSSAFRRYKGAAEWWRRRFTSRRMPPRIARL